MLRLFVVGAPRSGTTLLQSLLASHSSLVSFTESHFFSRHFGFVPGTDRALLRRDPLPRLREFLDENGVSERLADPVGQALGESLLPAALARAARSEAVGRAFLELLDQLARARGAGGWIEKTPRHLHYLPWLDQLADSPAHVIHIVRNGVDVVASLRLASKQWPETYDLQACIHRWNADLERSLERLGSGSDHFVFYDELTTNPESVVSGLLTELGLEWEPEMIERRTDVARSVVAEGESWKRDAERAITTSTGARDTLSAAERELAERELRTDLLESLRARSARGSRTSTEGIP